MRSTWVHPSDLLGFIYALHMMLSPYKPVPLHNDADAVVSIQLTPLKKVF